MKPFRALSTSEQLAKYLREEIQSGRMSGEMPGIKQLVKTHGVNSVSVTKAVQKLERDGLVIHQGDRRKRLIADQIGAEKEAMRVGLLFYDPQNVNRTDSLELKQALVDAGHTPVVAPKTMQDLAMDTQRIIRHVKSIDMDAWIIYAGSADLLQWFSEQETPAFAVYGRMTSVNIAGMGIRKSVVTEQVIEKLVQGGHRRIALIVREERRKPNSGLPERPFLEQLEAHGIATGPYNIPDWQDTPEGLEKCLNKLFEHTPPTALLIGDPVPFHAIQTHLSRRGINAPKDISLYCNDYAESFDWCRPTIAHLRWDYRPTNRRVTQWIQNIAQGQEDTKRSLTKAVYVDGETIGPAPGFKG